MADFNTFALNIPPGGRVRLQMRVMNVKSLSKSIMAEPIELTPTLTGKDAERFLRLMDEVKPVSREEMERIRNDYEYIKSIAQF